MCAVVSTGVTVALDEDAPSNTRTTPAVTPVTTSDGGLDVQCILAKVQPAVVAIEASASTSRGVFEGAGSGIVISEDGLILTNAHVLGQQIGRASCRERVSVRVDLGGRRIIKKQNQ